jgi:hypothetical protein
MEKSEETIVRERAAVEAMKGAKSNMALALDRISTLERALSTAGMTISQLKGFIAPDVYCYPHGNTPKKCRESADDAMASIAKVLG